MFEKDDTVASLSSIFKWSKASFLREGGIAAFVNKYKQVTCHQQHYLSKSICGIGNGMTTSRFARSCQLIN